MHICEDLHQRLDELKKQLAELDSLTQAVTDADSKQDLESLAVDEKLNGAASLLSEKQQELDGLKLNFKEEMAEYLGISEDILSSGDNKFELDEKGYLIILDCQDAQFSRQNLDFSTTNLEKIDLSRSNVQSVKVSDKTIRLSLSGCILSDSNPDFSATNLEIINLNYSNVQSVKVSAKTTSLELRDCTLSDPNLDFSATNLDLIDLNQSNVQSVKVSDKTISLDLRGCPLSDPNLDFSTTNLKEIQLNCSNLQSVKVSDKTTRLELRDCTLSDPNLDFSVTNLEIIDLSLSNVESVWLTSGQKQKYNQGKLIIIGITKDMIRIKPTESSSKQKWWKRLFKTRS